MKKLFLTLALSSLAFANVEYLINHKMRKLGIVGIEERMRFTMQEIQKISNPDYVQVLEFDYNKDMCYDSNDLPSYNAIGVWQYKAGEYKSAATWFDYACDKGFTLGCENSGASFEKLKDYSNSAIAYEKGCKLGSGISCNNLGWAYQHKLGKNQSYKKARELYIKACELGNGAGCDNVGWIYQNAKGVKKNTKTAKQYYKKACDLGFQAGCKNYKNIK